MLPLTLNWFKRPCRSISLRTVLVVPFVVQTVGAVALVGYLSYRSGQKTVTDLATRLMDKASQRVVYTLDDYFDGPRAFVQDSRAAIALGILDAQDFALMEPYFVSQLQVHTDISGAMVTTADRRFLAVGHLAPNQLTIRERNPATGALERYSATLGGDRGGLQDTLPNFDPHQYPPGDPWYGATLQAPNGHWRPVVSRVRGNDSPLLMMAYFEPITDAQGQVLGIISASAHLDHVGTFLQGLQISAKSQAFVVDETGMLIATSTAEPPFRTVEPTDQPLTVADLRLNATGSADPLIRAAAVWLRSPDNRAAASEGLTQFRVDRDRYFIHTVPFRLGESVQWTVVVLVPEADFMAEIHRHARITVALCVGTLGLAIAVGWLTTRRVTTRIQHINRASKALATGRLNQHLDEGSGIRELAGLAQAFNQMADQVRGSLQAVQTALAESEEKFTRVFHASPDPLGICTLAAGQLIEANDRFTEFFGYDRAEMIGQTTLSLGLWADVADRDRFYTDMRTAARVCSREISVRVKSGQVKTALISAEICRLGKQDCAIVGLQDISDRKAAELALQESESRFQTLVANAPGMLYRYLPSDDGPGTFTYVSTGAWEIFGLEPADILADANALWRLIRPEDWVTLQRSVAIAVERCATWSWEGRLTTPQGQQKWIQGRSRPCAIPHGIAWDGLFIDITNRKQAEIALTQEIFRRRVLFDTSIDGIVVMDETGNVLEANASFAAMLGYSLEEVKALNVVDFDLDFALAGDAPPNPKSLCLDRFERRHRRKDGSIYAVEISASAADWGDRQVHLCVCRDISDRQRAEQQLRQSEARYLSILEEQTEFVTRFDPDNTLIFVNEAFCRYYGITKAEAIGKSYQPRIYPDDQPLIDRSLAALSPKTPVNTVEHRVFAQGELRWTQWTNQAFYDEAGNLIELQSVRRDIHDRKQAELALVESEARFREISDASPANIYVLVMRPDGSFYFEHMSRAI